MNFLRLHISTSNGHPNHVTILSCLSESKKCKHVSSSSGRVVEGLLNSLVLPNGIWQMQLFQINQSEDGSKITIMYDNPSGQLHQRSIT